MRTHWLLVLSLVAGCGNSHGSSGSGGPAQCVDRSGSYRLSYVERSGNCGPLSEQVIVLDKQTVGAVAQCTGSNSASPDNCAITLDVTCPGRDPGYAITTTGVIHWAENAAMGAGIVQEVLLLNGSQQCSSSYDVTYSRL